MLLPTLVNVMSAGVWPLLKNLEDPELRRLAQSLPATVLRSRADTTTKKYLGAYQRWKTWAEARHETGEKLWKGRGLSYSRAREILLEKIQAMGWVPSQFAMHSHRAVGAAPAANADVSDQLFKRHGCWRSGKAKDGYVKDSVKKRLEVSKQLGL